MQMHLLMLVIVSSTRRIAGGLRGRRFTLPRNLRRGLIRKTTDPILVYGDRYVVVKRVTFYDVIDATGLTYGETIDLLAFLTRKLLL